jgi:hypothetical protein
MPLVEGDQPAVIAAVLLPRLLDFELPIALKAIRVLRFRHRLGDVIIQPLVPTARGTIRVP